MDTNVRNAVLPALLTGPNELVPRESISDTSGALSDALRKLQSRREEMTEALGKGLDKLAQVRPQLEGTKTEEEAHVTAAMTSRAHLSSRRH
jgi:hypothetical protein